MAAQGYLLVITATIAVIALVVALIAMRRLRAYEHNNHAPDVVEPAPIGEAIAVMEPRYVVPEQPEVRIVEGRVIVAPTNQQVLAATMGKPLVRIAVITAGFQYAFRPEARDRIRRLMRDEYRMRKTMRRKAAKEAAWSHQQANSSASVTSRESWL